MAVGVLRRPSAAALRVPDDLSVVGFDGIEAATWTDPTLTTIEQPIAEIAQTAVDTLRTLIEDPKAPPELLLPPQSPHQELDRTSPAVTPWWVDGVIYQIYPRSFADSNGDGIGDLRGITAPPRPPEWLGVDGIWLSPITRRPNEDWGYDVADYCDVDPDLGTLADARRAGRRGGPSAASASLLDLVPNHSSDQHPWFVDSRSSRDAAHRDWYVWADADAGDGGPPEQLARALRRAGVELRRRTGQYYLHHFLPEQPDLNWWNEDVRDEFDRILRFWFDRGVAGFRIDVCHMIVKDKQLRDNPPDPSRLLGRPRGRARYNAERPELHDVLRRWRRIWPRTYDPPRLLLGETYVLGPGRAGPLLRRGRRAPARVQLPVPALAPFHAEPLRQCRRATPRPRSRPARGRSWTRLQPRHQPVPDALGAERRPPRSASRCSCC